MNNIVKTLLICLPALVWLGCEQETKTSFTGDPQLYFYRNATQGVREFQNDSIAYTFFVKENSRQRDTVYIDLRAIGFPSSTARPISVVQVNAGQPGAAVAGEHYVAFDDPQIAPLMEFPAGEVKYKLPVIVNKTESMKLNEYRIEMELRSNDHFSISMQERSRFLVKVTDRATKPTNWDTKWVYYFGTWGSVKMKFIIEYVGITDFDGDSSFDSETTAYFTALANEKLEKYNKDNNTILMEDDKVTPVVFPK